MIFNKKTTKLTSNQLNTIINNNTLLIEKEGRTRRVLVHDRTGGKIKAHLVIQWNRYVSLARDKGKMVDVEVNESNIRGMYSPILPKHIPVNDERAVPFLGSGVNLIWGVNYDR